MTGDACRKTGSRPDAGTTCALCHEQSIGMHPYTKEPETYVCRRCVNIMAEEAAEDVVARYGP